MLTDRELDAMIANDPDGLKAEVARCHREHDTAGLRRIAAACEAQAAALELLADLRDGAERGRKGAPNN
jgi:hypothetical protein